MQVMLNQGIWYTLQMIPETCLFTVLKFILTIHIVLRKIYQILFLLPNIIT